MLLTLIFSFTLLAPLSAKAESVALGIGGYWGIESRVNHRCPSNFYIFTIYSGSDSRNSSIFGVHVPWGEAIQICSCQVDLCHFQFFMIFFHKMSFSSTPWKPLIRLLWYLACWCAGGSLLRFVNFKSAHPHFYFLWFFFCNLKKKWIC